MLKRFLLISIVVLLSCGVGNAFPPYQPPYGGGGGSGSGTVSPGTAGQVGVYTGATTIGGDSGFTYTTGGNVTIGTAGAGSLTVPSFTTPGLVTNNSSGGVVSTALNALCGVTTFTAAQCASFFGYYDPRWYGALVDGQYRSDVTTTAASATISSAGYTFTSADIGKQLSIWSGTAVTVTTSGSMFTNSNAVLVTSTTGLTNGMMLYGTNIPVGTYVTGVVSSTAFTMSSAVTAQIASGVTITAYPVKNTTISSVSAGNAVLAANMTSSISGNAFMAFGTDDSTAFQAADTAAAAAGGGLIKLPVGMSIVSSPTTIDNEVSVMGEGAGVSIIKWISTGSHTQPILRGINFVTYGNSCIYTNAVKQSNNHFSYFEIDALSSTQASYNVSGKGLSVSCSVNSSVDHVYIHDTPATCLATDFGAPTVLTNNLLVDCGRLGGVNAGSNGIGDGTESMLNESYVFTGNVIINPAHYGIFLESQTFTTTDQTEATISNNVIIQGGNSQVSSVSGGTVGPAGIGNSGDIGTVITGNYIYGIGFVNLSGVAAKWNGIAVDGGTLASAGGIQSVITGNYISNTQIGIDVDYSSVVPGGSQTSRTVINSNNIYNATSAGINIITPASGGSAANISAIGNQISSAGSACILVSGAGSASNLTLNNNVGFDCGKVTGTDYLKSGVAIAAPVTNLTMNGNNLYDDGANKQKYALSVNTSIAVTGAAITGNNFSNNVTKPFDILGTITGVFSGNIGMPAPTLSGCSATTPVGSGDAGTYTSGTTGSCPTVITPYGTANIIANNGYLCYAYDSTTPANIQTQTADTTTTATIAGTTVSADVVKFSCKMW